MQSIKNIFIDIIALIFIIILGMLVVSTVLIAHFGWIIAILTFVYLSFWIGISVTLIWLVFVCTWIQLVKQFEN